MRFLFLYGPNNSMLKKIHLLQVGGGFEKEEGEDTEAIAAGGDCGFRSYIFTHDAAEGPIRHLATHPQLGNVFAATHNHHEQERISIYELPYINPLENPTVELNTLTSKASFEGPLKRGILRQFFPLL